MPSPDIPASTETTAELFIFNGAGSPPSVVGEWDVGYDEDWYRVVLFARFSYAFLSFQYPDPDGIMLSLLDGSGRMMAIDAATVYGYQGISFVPTSTGVYYLSARSRTYHNHNDTYRLYAVANDTIPDNPSSTESLSINIPRRETMEVGENGDAYRVVLNDYTDYTFSLDMVTGGYLTLLNSGGNPVNGERNSNGNVLTYSVSPNSSRPPGVHYIVASPGGSHNRMEYTISYTGTPRNQGGAASTTTTTVSTPVVATGDIPANTRTSYNLTDNSSQRSTLSGNRDQDWFRVELEAGHAYAFDMVALRGTGFDPYLRLLDANGRRVASDNNGGGQRNALIEIAIRHSGTYFLSTESFRGNSSGTYLVTMEEGGASGRNKDAHPAILPFSRTVGSPGFLSVEDYRLPGVSLFPESLFPLGEEVWLAVG